MKLTSPSFFTAELQFLSKTPQRPDQPGNKTDYKRKVPFYMYIIIIMFTF